MTNSRYALLIVSLFLLATGGRADDVALARGAELLAPFKKDLKAALVESMQQGPAVAIDACRFRAPRIARSLSVDGVMVGRSSHRLRNFRNTTPAWAAPLLRAFLDNSDDRSPHVVKISADRWGYVEPITMQPLCLSCHGDSLAPEVSARIDALYPSDSATGFQVGDLRGIFWAEFPANE